MLASLEQREIILSSLIPTAFCPSNYFATVIKALEENHWDAWGGPDKSHEDFTLMQRAMGYTMSSLLTTGGIRGGKKHLGWFQPRSFNMGISRKVYEVTKGFKFDRFAEDIEFSIRMKKAGFNVGLIPDAFVYHKRRIDFKQFFNQVYNFGKGRALIGRVHPRRNKNYALVPNVFFSGHHCVINSSIDKSSVVSTGRQPFHFLFDGYFFTCAD